jgi:hypothetical protein
MKFTARVTPIALFLAAALTQGCQTSSSSLRQARIDPLPNAKESVNVIAPATDAVSRGNSSATLTQTASNATISWPSFFGRTESPNVVALPRNDASAGIRSGNSSPDDKAAEDF